MWALVNFLIGHKLVIVLEFFLIGGHIWTVEIIGIYMFKCGVKVMHDCMIVFLPAISISYSMEAHGE